MRILLACFLAIALLAPAPALAEKSVWPILPTKRKIWPPPAKARPATAPAGSTKAKPVAKRPSRAAPRRAVITWARHDTRPPARAVARRAAALARPARPTMASRPRPGWARRARRTAGWRAGWRARAARPAASYPRQPYEPPTPVFIGDLFVQADQTPLWGDQAGGNLIGRLPRATVVTNMGRYGPYYKVEAPNGSVGFVAARQLGPSMPAW